MQEITLLKTTYAENYNKSQGTKVNLIEFINKINDTGFKDYYSAKQNNPCFTVTNIGYRIAKEDEQFFNNWAGYIFVDLDHVTHIDLELERLHNEFSNKSYYVCSQKSASGNGLHFIFYIEPKFHTKLEFYTCVGIVYKYVDKIYKGEIDTHNANHSQILKISSNKWHINNNFDVNKTNSILDESRSYDDEYFFDIFKNDNYIYNIVKNNCFNNIYTKADLSITPELPNEIKLINKPSIVWDHNNRYILFNTLSYYFNEPDAKRICIEISKLNCKEDTTEQKITEQAAQYKHNDKYGVNRKIVQELVDVYGFDIYTKDNDDDITPDLTITIENYLSEKIDELLNNLGDVTLVELCAGGGKTTAVSNYIDNVILTEPYTSIIKNKIENDDELKFKFECLHDDLHLTTEQNRICCTPDKLININDELIRNIEYVFVDESHTIFTNTSFRLSVMAKFISKLKQLARNGKKVILMTGTPIKELNLFDEFDCKYIKIERPQKHNKKMTIQYVNNADVLKQDAIFNIAKWISQGYKIGIPCNKGDGYVSDIIAVLKNKFPTLEEQIDSFTYFKKEKINDTKNNDILKNGSIDNVSILFSTLYMGEGIDINYEGKVKIILFNLDTAQALEQYCARYRKIDIDALLYLNKDIDKSGKQHKFYNYSNNYKLEKVDEIELTDGANLMKIYLRNKTKHKKSIDILLSKAPYYDKETGELNDDCLYLYESSKSAMRYYRQFTVVKSMLEKYGFTITFNKTLSDDSNAKEINTFQLKNRKNRYMKEYTKALEIINNVDEKNIFDMHLTYKTKDKMISFIKQIYSCGIKFDDVKRIATIICRDNKVYWSEMQNILEYCTYLFEDKVNDRIFELDKCFVNDLKEWTTKNDNCSPNAWKKYKDKWIERYKKEYNVMSDNVSKNVNEMLDTMIAIHINAKQNANKMHFNAVDYGDILDLYYIA